MISQRGLKDYSNMYGASRSGRPIEARDDGMSSHLNMIPRRPPPIYGGVSESGGRGSRGKALVEEDLRDGSSRGDRSRLPAFSGKSSRAAAIEHAGHRHSDDAGRYGGVAERKFRGDEMLKMVRARDESPSPPQRGGARYRDGAPASHRGERVGRPLAYPDKWIANGYENGLNYDAGGGRDGSLRDSDYLPSRTKSTGGSSTVVLPGLVFECNKRSILEFSSQKGSFVLPFEDLDLAEHIGPGTRIFMFDSNAREIHGVFQAVSSRIYDEDSIRNSAESVIQVRVEKECLPLDERQFKAILHENYYTSSKFTENLSKDQVRKLLQTFRPRGLRVSLPMTRRIIDSGVSHTGEDFQGGSYREEGWRRGTVDGKPVGGHYHTQDGLRFSSKIPVQGHSTKSLDDYEDYVDDEAMDEMPLSSPRLIADSNPYATSRSKQQRSLRSMSGSRTAVSHHGGSVDLPDLKMSEGDWRDDRNSRDLVYSRKRLPLSHSSFDDLNRGGRSRSPPLPSAWGHSSRVDTAAGDLYDRSGRSASKDEPTYISSRRRRPNDIDLNIPLDVVHAEPAHGHDVDSRSNGPRGWNDDEEERYSISPLKGGSDPSRTSLHRSDHHVVPRADNYEDEDLRLESRNVPVATRNDYSSLLRMEEKSYPLASSYSNGKFTKPHPRSAQPVKNYHDKPVVNHFNRKKVVTVKDLYSKETLPKGPKVPVFQIKANLHAPGRGRAERVVTIVDKDRPWLTGSREKFIGGPTSVIQEKKRKASVWSRIELPDKGIVQSHIPFIANGRGRVFSRLGPSVDTVQHTDDFTFGYKSKRPRIQYEDMDNVEADLDWNQDIEDSPDALEGEDYLQDDDDLDGGPGQSDRETEVVNDQLTGEVNDNLQGWTRKKSSVVNSGIASGDVGHSDCTPSKGGRRKLVRPSIDENASVEQVSVSPVEEEAAKTLDHTSTEVTEVVRSEERTSQDLKSSSS